MTPGEVIRALLANPAPFSPAVFATPYDSEGIPWAPVAERCWPVEFTLPDVIGAIWISPDKES